MVEGVLCGELPETFAQEGGVPVGGAFHLALLLDVGLREDAFFRLVGHHSEGVSLGRKRVGRRGKAGKLTLRADMGR